MKPRTRLLSTIKHQEPDKVPLFIRFVGAISAKLAPIFDVTGHDLPIRIGNDGVLAQIGLNAEFSHKVLSEGITYTSEWGVTYQHIRGFNQPVDYPLKEPTLKGYQWPDPNRPDRLDEVHKVMMNYHDDYAVMVDLSSSLFEVGYAHLRGEAFFLDSFTHPEFVTEVMNGLVAYYSALGCRAIRAGIDIIRIGDDIGGQNGMMISPALWRALVKPALCRLVDAFKNENPDIIVKYHSCGDFRAVIPDLIEMGIELIGTMQPCGSMVPRELKAEFGNRVAFLGGLDTQQLLPLGSPAEVREGVREVLRAYAPGGGYIFMPAHYVNADVPLVNIWAMLEALRDHRTYPLCLDA
ncbi:MAG: uroporphyrinogen decarboxylase family protein [Candidatus Promineifilaceae bacterium]